MFKIVKVVCRDVFFQDFYQYSSYRFSIDKSIWKAFSSSSASIAPEMPVLEEDTEGAHPDMPVFDMENPYEREKRICILCKYKVPVDYKNIRLLSQFVSPHTGFLYDKHITGLCAEQQERVKRAIFISRKYGYMPYLYRLPKYAKDPRLFDPFKPSRPHPH